MAAKNNTERLSKLEEQINSGDYSAFINAGLSRGTGKAGLWDYQSFEVRLVGFSAGEGTEQAYLFIACPVDTKEEFLRKYRPLIENYLKDFPDSPDKKYLSDCLANPPEEGVTKDKVTEDVTTAMRTCEIGGLTTKKDLDKLFNALKSRGYTDLLCPEYRSDEGNVRFLRPPCKKVDDYNDGYQILAISPNA